jgi:hypothetical protein
MPRVCALPILELKRAYRHKALTCRPQGANGPNSEWGDALGIGEQVRRETDRRQLCCSSRSSRYRSDACSRRSLARLERTRRPHESPGRCNKLAQKSRLLMVRRTKVAVLAGPLVRVPDAAVSRFHGMPGRRKRMTPRGIDLFAAPRTTGANPLVNF